MCTPLYGAVTCVMTAARIINLTKLIAVVAVAFCLLLVLTLAASAPVAEAVASPEPALNESDNEAREPFRPVSTLPGASSFPPVLRAFHASVTHTDSASLRLSLSNSSNGLRAPPASDSVTH